MKVHHLILLPFLVACAFADQAEVGGTGEVVPPTADCDAVCNQKVAHAIGNANREKEGIVAELNGVRGDLERARQQVNAKNADIDALKSHINGLEQKIGDLQGELAASKNEVNAAKAEVATFQKAVEEAHSALASSKEELSRAAAGEAQKVAAANAKAKALEDELSKTKQDADDLANARILVNMNLIKQDVKDLLKKVGLAK